MRVLQMVTEPYCLLLRPSLCTAVRCKCKWLRRLLTTQGRWGRKQGSPGCCPQTRPGGSYYAVGRCTTPCPGHAAPATYMTSSLCAWSRLHPSHMTWSPRYNPPWAPPRTWSSTWQGFLTQLRPSLFESSTHLVWTVPASVLLECCLPVWRSSENSHNHCSAVKTSESRVISLHCCSLLRVSYGRRITSSAALNCSQGCLHVG